MTSRHPRSILANLVNDVMIEPPAPVAYARKMAAVSPRKLWQAGPGDCVVALAPCPPHFRDYVESVTGVPAGSVDVVAPDRLVPAHACQVITDLDAVARVASRPTLMPFVADSATVAFARRTGMRVHPYDPLPDEEALAAARLINTKAGFRAVAGALGLPVAAGGHAATAADLVTALRDFLGTRRRAIVKLNRSSNGHATFVVTAGTDVTIAEQVASAQATHPEPGCGWVYEEFLEFRAVPSVELLVDSAGVQPFYVCDQRTRDNAWTGMVTPPEQPVPPAVLDAADRIGGWLAGKGYRGYFDVDAGLVGDGFVVTEANVRRTGGTYLEELARALRPGPAPHWRADARRGTTRFGFADAVRALDRAGLNRPEGHARVLLPADTLDVDSLWRYLVIGSSATDVADAEQELVQILELT